MALELSFDLILFACAARDFNITKAEEMLRKVKSVLLLSKQSFVPNFTFIDLDFKNLEWRRQNHANNARMLPICRELDAYYSFYIPGFDRLGRPGETKAHNLPFYVCQ